jgi:hypothetical protein
VEEWVDCVVLLVVDWTEEDDEDDVDDVVERVELEEELVLDVVGVGVADVVDVVEGRGVVEVDVDVEVLLLDTDWTEFDDGAVESDSPALKTTIVAFTPCGTVTTQKSAPPAPDAD